MYATTLWVANDKIYKVIFLFFYMEKELFKEIGLNLNEGKVYSELVKHGKLSASETSSKSGVPYGKIYVVLQGLVDKGLVQIIPEKTKKFIASSPENLVKLIDNKKKILEKAREKISELKQFYEKKDKDFLIIGEGDKGFWKIVDEMEEVEDYSYNIKWDSKIQPGSLEKSRKRLKKGIDSKDLVRYDRDTEKNVHKWLKVKKNIRKFPNEGVALSVLDDKEVMVGLIKKNTTILIRDKAFTKVMKRLFLGAYDVAKKIK